MTPFEQRTQFDISQLAERIEALERVAPAMPDEIRARLDRLCDQMNSFTLSVWEHLAKMAPQAPEPSCTTVQHPAPEPKTTELPDISVGWIGGSRRA